MARRRIPRHPEVKVAVRTEVQKVGRLEASAFAVLSLLTAWMASVWWMNSAQFAP